MALRILQADLGALERLIHLLKSCSLVPKQIITLISMWKIGCWEGEERRGSHPEVILLSRLILSSARAQ